MSDVGIPPPVEFTTADVVQVVMTGNQADAYQNWLRSRGPFLCQVPLDDDADDLPTYVIGYPMVGTAQT